MAFATRLTKIGYHSEHFNERTWMCYHQAPPWERVVAHVRDAGQAKPHREHNPLSLLGACNATPIRKLNDPGRVQAVLDKRLGRYGLTLHPEKTRLVPFRCPSQGQQRGQGPATFD